MHSVAQLTFKHDPSGMDSIILPIIWNTLMHLVFLLRRSAYLHISFTGICIPIFLLLYCKFMHPLQESFRNICKWSNATRMSSNAASLTAPSPLQMTNSSNSGDATKETAGSTPAAGGHMMSATDPDNPQNWPVYKKVYVSVVAFAFSWVV